jgi:hypothetical protein
MKDDQNNLLIKMTLKIYEARTYSTIKLFLFILWFIDFLLVIFRYLTFDVYYWLLFIIFLVSNYHMEKKRDKAMIEYEELNSEYKTRFED